MMADFSTEIWSPENSKQNPNVLKQKENLQPGTGHPVNLSFKKEDKISIFLGKLKLKEFTTNNISLREFLKTNQRK